MRHIWFLGMVGACSGLLFYLYSVSVRASEADPLDVVLTLSPAPAAIRQEMAAHDNDHPALTAGQRQDLFAELFTQRFRKHEAKMAVRARFVEVNHVRNRIKLMCPARMEPWNMDRVALAVWREAKDCLGQVYDIDIYETFIGALPRKVGELRATRGKIPAATILYVSQPTRSHSESDPETSDDETAAPRAASTLPLPHGTNSPNPR